MIFGDTPIVNQFSLLLSELSIKTLVIAMTRVLIESSDKSNENWFTIGVSPNIIEASFRALIDSIDYKLYKSQAPENSK